MGIFIAAISTSLFVIRNLFAHRPNVFHEDLHDLLGIGCEVFLNAAPEVVVVTGFHRCALELPLYHEGGIVGGGDIKSNEQLSLLKTKEWVLSEQMVDNLTTQMDRINMLSDAMSDLPDYAGKSTLSDVMKQVGGSKTVNNITNNSRPIEVQIGDTIIHGADQSTVDKHIKVTRDMVNQIGRLIGIGR